MNRTLRTELRVAQECFLVALPILVYVGLEAGSQGSWAQLALTPEWSIATIFLGFQALRLFIEKLNGAPDMIKLWVLLGAVVIIIVASVNAYMGIQAGIDHQSWTIIVIRFVLLALALLLFVYLGGAAIWQGEKDQT